MDAEKYSREIKLLCPTCGGTTFEYEEGGTVELVKCVSCEREMTKDELMRENSESVSEHMEQVKEEFVKDGANKVTESMIQGATMTGAKATEKIIKNN